MHCYCAKRKERGKEESDDDCEACCVVELAHCLDWTPAHRGAPELYRKVCLEEALTKCGDIRFVPG
jgi:hypothetical protein